MDFDMNYVAEMCTNIKSIIVCLDNWNGIGMFVFLFYDDASQFSVVYFYDD